jgi:Protein of unknown function (DUF3168)
MSSIALMEIQRALYTKLSGDGVLMGIVAGIYDNVPQNTPLPYVVIGDGNQNIRPADAVIVTECQLELQVWTDVGGRKTALTILNRLHALLHLGTLTLSGFQLVTLRVEQASTTLAEQGALVGGALTLFVTVVEV